MQIATVLDSGKAQLRHGREQLAEDWTHLRAGVLDSKSFINGWRPMTNPVEVCTTSVLLGDKRVNPALIVNNPNAYSEPVLRKDGSWGEGLFGGAQRYYREIRRQHNLQLTVGKNQIQRIQSFGDVGTGLNGSFATYTGTTATTLTGASGQPTASSAAGNTGLQGKICYVTNATVANSVFGIIISNTATVITVDQWYAIPVTGAAGTTPTSGAGTATIFPGGTWAWWVALSTNSAAAAAGDVTRTADGLWADGSSGAAATELTGSGMDRAYCGQGGATAPTIPGSGQIQFNHTWTYTGSSLTTVQKVVLFNSKPFAGTIPLLETLLSASATVSANGDTIALSGWSITC